MIGGGESPHARWPRAGRYEIVCELGQGGMAVVYLGRADGPGGFERLVAIKMIHEHLCRRGAFVSMFLDEARIAARIRHPNVVPVFEIGEEDGRYFIVMDYVSGETLAEALTQASRQRRPFPIDLCLHLFAVAADALHAAHELTDPSGRPLGVIHRDVTPQNLILGYDGVLRVLDFGVARATDRLTQTRPGGQKGTVAYMAPEQLTDLELDRRADLFSLGVVLWETLTARRLFKGNNDFATADKIKTAIIPDPRLHRPDCPEELSRIVFKALARDREQRYSTGRELAAELRRVLASRSSVPSPSDVEHFLFDLLPGHLTRRQQLEREAAFLQEPTLMWSPPSGSLHFTPTPEAEAEDVQELPAERPIHPLALLADDAGEVQVPTIDLSPRQSDPVPLAAFVEPRVELASRRHWPLVAAASFLVAVIALAAGVALDQVREPEPQAVPAVQRSAPPQPVKPEKEPEPAPELASPVQPVERAPAAAAPEVAEPSPAPRATVESREGLKVKASTESTSRAAVRARPPAKARLPQAPPSDAPLVGGSDL